MARYRHIIQAATCSEHALLWCSLEQAALQLLGQASLVFLGVRRSCWLSRPSSCRSSSRTRWSTRSTWSCTPRRRSLTGQSSFQMLRKCCDLVSTTAWPPRKEAEVATGASTPSAWGWTWSLAKMRWAKVFRKIANLMHCSAFAVRAWWVHKQQWPWSDCRPFGRDLCKPKVPEQDTRAVNIPGRVWEIEVELNNYKYNPKNLYMTTITSQGGSLGVCNPRGGFLGYWQE